MDARMLSAAIIPLLAGISCIGFRGPEDLRRDLSRQAGVKLHREMGITVGRGGMMLARWGMKLAGEKEISLKGVRKVQVGIYTVSRLRRGFEGRARLSPADLPGWHPLVRVREEDADVMVLTRDPDGEMDGLLVVVAEDDEWILVRINGPIRPVLESAMELAFREADRPDMLVRVQREREAAEEPPGTCRVGPAADEPLGECPYDPDEDPEGAALDLAHRSESIPPLGLSPRPGRGSTPRSSR